LANTVNAAFSEFMRDKVNLHPDSVKKARSSRDNLIANIHNLGSKDNFFNLYNDVDIAFGSFARGTKIRPLDDIDLIIGIMAEGTTYSDYTDKVVMYVNNDNIAQNSCVNIGTNILNSTKVINKFIGELQKINDYKKSELHKNGAAATLQLKSYAWNFDIVPCFFTTKEADGRNYYLIPDGKGNWQKTDPRKDRDNVTRINQKQNGRVLDTIRLAKYWNRRPTMPSVPSYVFECLLLQYFDNMTSVDSEYIDLRFCGLLKYIADNIFSSINDPKGIQGDLNKLSFEEKLNIKIRALEDLEKANEAVYAETTEKNQQKSIAKWREIFGSEFPQYG